MIVARTFTPALRSVLLAATIGSVALTAHAQGHGGPPGMGMGKGGGMDHGPMGGDRYPGLSTGQGSSSSGGSLQLGPSGRWWDDRGFAKAIGLNSMQQHHMDDVFSANKDTLLKLLHNLQHEESQLNRMARSREAEENQIYQQIDRVTAARGELEKANAHYLLQIRKELTPTQVSRLDDITAQQE